ncbi:MAG: DUF559 domain-containing protein [Sporichthyaceae bacterium]
MDIVDALRALGGASRAMPLRRLVGRRSMRDALAEGSVVRVRGVWQLADRGRGLTAAVEMRGVRSHRSAAEFWGFALPPAEADLHDVTVPAKARRAHVPDDVRLRYRDLPDDVRAVGVTPPIDTVVDCLRDLSLREALSVGDSALRSGKVRLEELRLAVHVVRGPGARKARERCALLDARAANAFESSARALLLEAGLTGFQPQVTIRNGDRWLGRVDLADPVLRIVVECEGFAFHSDRGAFLKDLVRYTSLVAAGWRPLRFSWEQVMFDCDWVVARVREAAETGTTDQSTASGSGTAA